MKIKKISRERMAVIIVQLVSTLSDNINDPDMEVSIKAVLDANEITEDEFYAITMAALGK